MGSTLGSLILRNRPFFLAAGEFGKRRTLDLLCLGAASFKLVKKYAEGPKNRQFALSMMCARTRQRQWDVRPRPLHTWRSHTERRYCATRLEWTGLGFRVQNWKSVASSHEEVSNSTVCAPETGRPNRNANGPRYPYYWYTFTALVSPSDRAEGEWLRYLTASGCCYKATPGTFSCLAFCLRVSAFGDSPRVS